MKYNYPVKYVVMPIIQEPCYGNDYERTILCYIVSKCYVLKETIEYNSEGFGKKQYEVQCPYREDEYDWHRVCPNGARSFYTDTVYDKLSTALRAKITKNKELLESLPCLTNKQYEEYKKEYLENQSKYDELERLMIENTPDLIVNNPRRSQSFLQYYPGKFDDKGKLIRYEAYYSVYELFSGYHCKEDYIVYSVSEEEYKEYRASTPDNYEKFAHTPLLLHKANSPVVTLTNGDKLIHLSVVNKVLEEVTPEEGSTFSGADMITPGIIVFTRETYEDIVSSYNLDNKYKKTLVLSNN